MGIQPKHRKNVSQKLWQRPPRCAGYVVICHHNRDTCRIICNTTLNCATAIVRNKLPSKEIVPENVFAKKQALRLQNVKWPDLWTKTNVNFLFDYAVWTQLMTTSWAKFAVIALSTLNKRWRSRQNWHASTRIQRENAVGHFVSKILVSTLANLLNIWV